MRNIGTNICGPRATLFRSKSLSPGDSLECRSNAPVIARAQPCWMQSEACRQSNMARPTKGASRACVLQEGTLPLILCLGVARGSWLIQNKQEHINCNDLRLIFGAENDTFRFKFGAPRAQARVAELVDAKDLKSFVPKEHGDSISPPGTILSIT
jgi:hypothetical protein